MRIAALIAASLLAAPALAEDRSPSDVGANAREELMLLSPDDMQPFIIHDAPRQFRDQVFFDENGDEIDLSAFAGTVTVVNFWAIWCPPCVKELPSLNALSEAMADEGVRVAVISVDRGGLKKAGPFLEKHELSLTPYTDPKSKLARQMGVSGLPVTAILGPDGREIARTIGDAEWDSDAAKDLLRFIVEATTPAEAS